MYRILISVVLLLSSMSVLASVTFSFDSRSSAGIANKTQIERNITMLLTEIDEAGEKGGVLTYDNVNMEEPAKLRLNSLWEIIPFVITEDRVVSKCLHDHQGYQVRGINVTVKPKDNTYEQSLSRQLTISISKTGIITGVRFTLENQEDVFKIMGENSAVTDMAQRREILKFVEDFRCYYNEKNLNALNNVFSEKALIITGSVISQKQDTDASMYVRSVKYKVQNKVDYLNNLERIFDNNRFIDVRFDNISVVRHGSKPYLYGVTLHQTWKSSNYSDEGWIFLVWDFSEPDKPKIHVRSWQPDAIVAEDGVMNLHDFYFR